MKFVFVEEVCVLRLTEVLAYVLLSLVKLLVLVGGWVLSLALKELLEDVESLDSLLLLQLILFVGFVLVQPDISPSSLVKEAVLFSIGPTAACFYLLRFQGLVVY